MKNSLIDLNNHLFAQIERLSAEDISMDQLKLEVQRTYAINAISEKLIKNAALILEAEQLRVGLEIQDRDTTKLLTGHQEKLVNAT
ncbi:MAG: hypothetical protein K2W88_15135 [Pararheinheimera sp.]|nr:hypothetical protein [Rheinheimera sp.]